MTKKITPKYPEPKQASARKVVYPKAHEPLLKATDVPEPEPHYASAQGLLITLGEKMANVHNLISDLHERLEPVLLDSADTATVGVKVKEDSLPHTPLELRIVALVEEAERQTVHLEEIRNLLRI